MKKILIVDDEKRCRDRFSGLIHDCGLEIIIAEGAQEGIRKALSEMPDMIITDKDMPDGTGNDVARAAKQAYNPRIAGLTGGDLEDFDEKVVDVRYSKSISDEQYKGLVKILAESRNPREDFEKAMGIYISDFEKAVMQALHEYTAIDILVQGYMLAQELLEGKQPVEGVELRLPSEEEADSLLDTEDIGISADELYKTQSESIRKAAEGIGASMSEEDEGSYMLALALAGDKRVESFMADLAAKDYRAIQEKKEYIIFDETFVALCEACQKKR